MKCPSCGLESRVVDSRPVEEDNSIRRRRECTECRLRFTTYEIVELTPIFVVKKDGAFESFDRNKILSGLVNASYKRPVSADALNMVVAEIESELQNAMVGRVTSTAIGDMVIERLKNIDEVAYVRFASVYREFRDAETFMRELQMLRENDK